MNKEDVIHGLKTLAKQERKAQSLLTKPREAPQEFERWYIAEVLESAVLIIEQRDRLAEAAQAVVDRWETPFWKQVEHTGVYIAALRKAVEEVKGGIDEQDA